jgi:hypothetical protein
MKASDILIINGQQNFEAESVRKPSGHIIVEGQEVADTLQCKHCNSHFVVIKGSGVKRGWCTHCNGALCGSPECMECVDFRKKLDEYESGRRKTLK